MADQRIQYTEEMVGANHPSKSDTLNRLALVEHNTDGTHKAASKVAGDVVQVVSMQEVAMATGTTAIPVDDTIPQNTEGDEFMTLAITPTNANNKLIIDVSAICSHSVTNDRIIMALFQDSAADAIAVSGQHSQGEQPITMTLKYPPTVAGTTSETTFKVRIGGEAGAGGTLTFNGHAGARKMGGKYISSITITEVKV